VVRYGARHVNFLSHDRLLGEGVPALAHVGAALPDLWPLLAVRPLPLVVLRRLRASGERDAATLAYGIAHHMHADAAFHGHHVFEARMASAARRLRSHLDTLRHPGLAAHVLVEMLLDRWLIDRDPQLVDAYYDHFSDAGRRRACDLSSEEPGVRDDLAGVLDRFTVSRFLADYATFEGIALRLVRTLRRVGVLGEDEIDLAALAADVGALRDELESGSEALLEDVAARVEASLVDAGIAPP